MPRTLRILIITAAVAVSSSLLAPGSARAQGFFGGGQGGIVSDPFSFYYAFYLPNQQLQSMRPNPMDSINNAMAVRQYYARTDRQSLYNPISPYADANSDPLRPYSPQGQERVARPYRFSQNPSNADGGGPSLYYNRATQYFPTLRVGRGPNGNVSSRRSSVLNRRPGGGGGMGGGMGGMGGGMGGMGGGMGGTGGMGGMGMV